MTWFRVDDSFSDHAKVVALLDMRNGLRAVGLWTLAGSWTAKHEQDGFVPSAMIKRLGGTSAEASSLVAAGLWIEDGTGYRFHGWSERNPLKAALDERRHGVTDRQRRHREKSGHGSVTRDTDEPVTRDEKALQRDVTRSLPRPYPDPTLPLESERAEPTHTLPGVLEMVLGFEQQEQPPTDRGRAPSEPAARQEPVGLNLLRPEPVDRLPEPEAGYTARRMQVAFIAEFEAVQRSTPSMGGKNVGTFHAAVLRTAELQGADPEVLFLNLLRTWLAKSLTERERQSPYACFAQAWGSLASGKRDVRGGFVAPAPASAFTNPTDLDKVFGPELPATPEKRPVFAPRSRS